MSAESVLAETARISVTTSDIQGEALRIPPESRREALSKPENLVQLAGNLAVRRAVAAEAEAAGLASDAAVQGALRVARDRVLSDALFARMDAANKPTAQALDALALTTYRADPKRYEAPAETNARHILIRRETPDAKAIATGILEQLKAGADFDTVAREKSQDPGSAAKGGDLGFFGPGRMVPPFEAAVSKLQTPGELSDVVETQFGYHIIKLESRRSAGVRPFAEVKDALRKELEMKIVHDARLAEVDRIRAGIKFNQVAIEEFAASNK